MGYSVLLVVSRVWPARGPSSRGWWCVRDNGHVPAVKILVIDNYDSFVYNLVQYLAQIGAEVEVWRNDDPRFDDPSFTDGFDGILLSPGPGTPEEAGVCIDVVRNQAGDGPDLRRVPGAAVDRGRVRRRGRPRSRAAARQDLADRARGPRRPRRPAVSPFTATRYHSLAIEPEDVAGRARGDGHDGQRRDHGGPAPTLPVEAVQFHPESVLTEGGYQMLANWLASAATPTLPPAPSAWRP